MVRKVLPVIKTPTMPKMTDIQSKVRARIEEAKKKPIVRKVQPVTKTVVQKPHK
jgi:hypothetical protein